MSQSVLMAGFFLCSYLSWSQQQVVVHFDVNKTALQAGDQQKLATVARNDRIDHIKIEGYADTTGNEAHNQQLSRDRAQSVYRYLLRSGLDKKAVDSVLGRGTLSSHQQLAENRKVTVSYVEAQIEDQSKDTDKKAVREATEIVPPKKDEQEEPDDHKLRTRDGQLNTKTISSMEVGDILNISAIQFVPGRHRMTRKSDKSVKKLIQVMEENPTLKIEIQGHICCRHYRDGVDQDTGKKNLSEIRALEVYKALRKAGIDKERMTYKGYGPRRKLVKEIDEASRQRNRRVSIQLLSR